MIMFPAHLSSSRYVNGGFSDTYDCFISLGIRGFYSDLMAEDDSRTETSNNKDHEDGSSLMKDVNNNNIHDGEMNVSDDGEHGRWLQLSLGGGYLQSGTSQGQPIQSLEVPSVDLDLLPGGGGDSSSRRLQQPPRLSPSPPAQLFFQAPGYRGHPPTISTTLFLQPHETTAAAMNSVQFMSLQQHQHQQQPQQQTNYNYNYLQLIRPFPANMMTTPLNPPISSSSSFSGSSEQHGRVLNVHRRLNVARVVNPPRRPHSGVWFVLQASQNQAKEPFLPQIPKSYLRIKDGRMTVGLLIKYLVNKLELGSESEIEITCKGSRLLSLSTLQHVRDTIWNSPRNDVGFSVLAQSSATINHLMVLNYGRIA